MRTFSIILILMAGNFAFAAPVQQQPLTGGADPSTRTYYCAIKQGSEEIDFAQVVASSQAQAALKAAAEKLTIQNGELVLRQPSVTPPADGKVASVTEVDCQELK